jgi:hypothetical protein
MFQCVVLRPEVNAIFWETPVLPSALVPVFETTGRCLGSRQIAAACGAVLVGTSSVNAPAAPAGTAARTVVATEHVALTLVKKTGTRFQHNGRATGTVAGSVTSQITLTSLSIAGTVTVRAKGGTLKLKIRGTARTGGLRAKFDGTASMVGGTGRYAKARGGGTFTGVVNRRSWAATIDARGTMTTP